MSQKVEKQDKIISILREQVNILQGEVINILKNMCELESCTEPIWKVDIEMDVDQDNLKISQNVGSLREVTWDEGEDETYKELLVFKKNAVKIRNDFNHKDKLDLAFNNVKPKDWCFVLD